MATDVTVTLNDPVVDLAPTDGTTMGDRNSSPDIIDGTGRKALPASLDFAVRFFRAAPA